MKRLYTLYRPAFTMLELIFVIVILGIVASLGSQIIVQAYESYIIQRALHRSSLKTELVAIQIANRLAYAIPQTVIGRKTATDSTYKALEEITTNDYKVLQWIGYDNDSFTTITSDSVREPGWSGFADIEAPATDIDIISTPGSKLSLANAIITNLSTDTSAKTLTNAAVLFPFTYDVSNIGYDMIGAHDTSAIAKISGFDSAAATISFDTETNRTIKEHYKLAWSSYAIVPLNRDGNPCTYSPTTPCDLHLRYNFQPWDGVSNYQNAPSSVLIRNVSVFKFTATANSIRFKLCIQEDIGLTNKISICKEKAVIR